MCFWLKRSNRRPGVATKISTPRLMAVTCAFCPTPPKTTVCLKGMSRPYTFNASPICTASSRVGASIRARVDFAKGLFSYRLKWWRIGRPNAAVFPVPVCAIPKRSLRSIRSGIAFSCIGVGKAYCCFFKVWTMRSVSPRQLKVVLCTSMLSKRFDVFFIFFYWSFSR